MPNEPRHAASGTARARTHRVADHRELLALSGNDPYVRWGQPDPLPGLVLASGDAVAVERLGRRRGFWVWPLPSAAAPGDALEDMLLSLRDEGHLQRQRTESLSVPQPYAARRAKLFEVGAGGDWDWMWTTRRPAPESGEDRLVELSDRDHADEILALARAHNPRNWTEPGTGRTELWLGLRDDAGELVAVGGMERLDSGVAHLAGIVTSARQRGRGLGRIISATLTRRAIEQDGVCTLGMYSDNVAARVVYTRLGYRTAKAWSSRRLA